jgi:hypothetical protein
MSKDQLAGQIIKQEYFNISWDCFEEDKKRRNTSPDLEKWLHSNRTIGVFTDVDGKELGGKDCIKAERLKSSLCALPKQLPKCVKLEIKEP